jgi:hypothetical protein
LWAMARDREKRIATLDAFADELEPFATQHSFLGQMTESERPLPALPPSTERSSLAAPARASAAPTHGPDPIASTTACLDTQEPASSPISDAARSSGSTLAPASRRWYRRSSFAAMLSVLALSLAWLAWWQARSESIPVRTSPPPPPAASLRAGPAHLPAVVPAAPSPPEQPPSAAAPSALSQRQPEAPARSENAPPAASGSPVKRARPRPVAPPSEVAPVPVVHRAGPMIPEEVR